MKTHREIAAALDLMHAEPEGPGMVFWHPKGWRLFRNIKQHMRRVYECDGFQEISTPILLKRDLWRRSGHWEKFSESMFVGGDFDAAPDYAIKPMSCPAHILMFKRGVYSYRDLPLRLFEFGTVHRNEPSGSLNGCLRLRQFTQDDAHVFCAWHQAAAEVGAFLERARRVYGDYGYGQIRLRLATRPANAFGSDADWERAQDVLASACRDAGYDWEHRTGEGAFYGPKIEIVLTDVAGREWQCGTMQLDFNLPARFAIDYVRDNNRRERPVLLHQAVYGSLERWLGILLETYQGRLPAWIHPQPVALALVGVGVSAFAQEVVDHIRHHGLQPLVDAGDSTLARKIRHFHALHIPCILVIGPEEAASRTVSLRRHSGGNERIELSALSDRVSRLVAMPDRAGLRDTTRRVGALRIADDV